MARLSPGSKTIADPLEVELKLEYDPADHVRLVALEPLALPARTERQRSTYYDTPEHAIRRAGYTLRVRQAGGRRVQTVKAAGAASAGLFERSEWERPLRSGRPRLDPASGPLGDLLGPETLTRISPCFVSDIERIAIEVDAGDARIAAAIDQGVVRAGASSEPVSELELELCGGPVRQVYALARALDAAVPLRLGVRSKAERGYALADGERAGPVRAEPVALDHDGDAGDAFRVIVQACIRHFRLNEALLLRTGEAEALHQARVGLRRLRSAFALFAPLLENDPQAVLLNSELRWLAAELGEVRNIDVLIRQCSGEARAALVVARDFAFGHARTALCSSRARSLMIDLAEWLMLGTWRTAPAHPARLHRDATSFAGGLLETHRSRLKRRGKRLGEIGPRRRHAARIEAKKLRYAADFFASLYAGRHARRRHARYLEALEALQDALGELNDMAIAAPLLARLGIDAGPWYGGKRRQRRLLKRAGKAYARLIRARRFW